MRIRCCMLIMFVGLLTLTACGGPSAKVTGRVTCQGKAVPGSILFSPKGSGGNNAGAAVTGQIKDDGSYEVKLATLGMHSVVITPTDVKYPVPPGEFDHPCDRSPVEREVKAGDNEITIEMSVRVK